MNIIRQYFNLYQAITRLKDYLRDRNQTMPGLYSRISDVITEWDKAENETIPEVNPNCPECNGEGVILYNFSGYAKFKDDEDYLNPEVREEPCPKCERRILA